MKKKILQSARQKNRIRLRLLIVCVVVTSVLLIAGSLLIVFNLNNASKTRAAGTGTEGGGGGNELNNGEIISEFMWDAESPTTATLGPDADKSSKEAVTADGGRSSTKGLSPGSHGKNIDLEITGTQLFALDGIDISIDYRKSESDGDFFSRGNVFNFGFSDGLLIISYCTETKSGRVESIKAKTQYEIPADPIYRTYRFIYTPTSGKAEVFVNNVVVWQHQHEKNTPLSWKNAGNIIIGRNMNGDGDGKAILDNLVIRSTGSVAPLAESLLNFMLEANKEDVQIHWSSSANAEVNYFTIERSVNGVDFINLTNVKSNPAFKENEEYVYTDHNAHASSIIYYRLRQTFNNGKFVTHPLSAIRFKSDKGFAIDHISPLPFKSSCDISFYLPKSGRVWLQVNDEKGNTVTTSSFEAPEGKNVRVFRDEKNLDPGKYTFSLIFDNKKLTADVIKI